MDIAKVELEAIEKVVVADGELNLLSDLDLVLVGGGTGAVSLG